MSSIEVRFKDVKIEIIHHVIFYFPPLKASIYEKNLNTDVNNYDYLMLEGNVFFSIMFLDFKIIRKF